MNPVWILEAVVLALHEEHIAEHGGPHGLRDLRLLQSALSRPQQLAHYAAPDIAGLAAAYGYGLARNHPFLDGNKRTAFVVSTLFLMLNGYQLVADDDTSVRTILDLAAGTLSEEAFGEWVRRASVARDVGYPHRQPPKIDETGGGSTAEA